MDGGGGGDGGVGGTIVVITLTHVQHIEPVRGHRTDKKKLERKNTSGREYCEIK